MGMQKHTAITILFFLILCFSGITHLHAQEKKLEKANKSYQKLAYIDAQKVYLTVAEQGFESEELFTKLGNSYYFNAQYNEAVKWYERLFDLNEEPEQAILSLRYSQALNATGDNDKAAYYYNEYRTRTGTNLDVKTVIDYQKLIQQNSGRYELQALSGIYDENKISFGHTKLGNKLVYASTQTTKTFLNKRSAWDGLSFLSLYEVELDQQNKVIGKPKKLKKKLNSKFHESSPIYTKDGKTMYFTRSNITYKTKNKDKKLKIYRTVKEKGKWNKPIELSFNDDTYSSAHPALSPDGKKLYFSSDRPGGYGESDLYVAVINDDGSIGIPQNLGATINTVAKETFPFISASNELYFSSDGHFGLGGLDVFYVNLNQNSIDYLLNVGAPINSYADDFALGIDQSTKRGFISSNRSSKEGEFVYDNIYSFLELQPINDPYLANLKGYVTDKHTGLPLANSVITLSDLQGQIYNQLSTDQNGYYEVSINKFETYYVKAEKEDYDTDQKISKANLETQQIDFELQPNKVAITSGTDLAKVLNIPVIHFDFDKSNIRQDAKVELEKVLMALKTYDQLRLNIRSHTDSRGNDAYNKALSERRAKSTLDYLVSKGVDINRLESEGLGEAELLNKCDNGVPCSASEHQKNRRSEFIILK